MECLPREKTIIPRETFHQGISTGMSYLYNGENVMKSFLSPLTQHFECDSTNLTIIMIIIIIIITTIIIIIIIIIIVTYKALFPLKCTYPDLSGHDSVM